MKATRVGRVCVLVAFAFALLAYSAPAAAQSGTLKGKVTGPDGKPLEGAAVVIEHAATARKNQSKTDRRGEYVQVGLTPGEYKVTVTSGDLTQTQTTRIGAEVKELHFDLKPGAAPAGTGKPSAEEMKKHEARIAKVQENFKAGAEATNAGRYDEAIAKFNEVLVDLPTCKDCYNNLGIVYSRQKDWVKAEESFKKAIEIDPKFVDAHNGLANVYTAQGKTKEAQDALAEATKLASEAAATGGGNVTALYNGGITAWNANDFQKAHDLFQQAIKVDPKHAESHFMLGRALINLGKLGEAATEFETYLKLAPSGPNAKEAQSNFDALKQYRK